MEQFTCWRLNEGFDSNREEQTIEAPTAQDAAEQYAEEHLERHFESMLVCVHHALKGTQNFRVEIEWEPSCLAKLLE